jgi:hypothetical protein
MLGQERSSEIIPLRQYIDNLLSHDKRRVVYDAGRPDAIFGYGHFSIEECFSQDEKPSFDGDLLYC